MVLSGCSALSSNKIAPGYFLAYEEIKKFFSGSENNLDLNYIKSIPYASMIVQIGNGPSGLMILESKTNNMYTWVSADGVYLVTKEGRIIQSSGLPNNLDLSINSFTDWEAVFKNKQLISYSSFDEPALYNLKIFSNFNILSSEEIDLQLRVLDLKLIEEKILAPSVGWEAINQYWMDDNNFVWKSNQKISPLLPSISYVITKKPL